jgi:hypothetical protein
VLEGVAVFVHEAAPCRVDYRVRTTEHWRTRDAYLSGWVGNRSIDVGVEVDAEGNWVQNDVECPAVAGCIDVDLGFSPSTNTVAIQRLGLAVGQSASVRAAWLPFPLLELQVLDQRYTRIAESTYAYESGSFKAQLDVDRLGLVQMYSGLWQRT